MHRLLLPLLALATACGAARVPAELPSAGASYKTTEGAREVRHKMARWYIDNDMPSEALRMVSELRDMGETGYEVDLIQAEGLAAEGLLHESEHLLLQLLQARPDDARPHRTLGIVYADMLQIDQAIDQFQTALQLEPGHPGTANNLGYLLLAQGDCAGAETQLASVLDQDASEARFRNNLALAKVCNGKPEEALQLFRSNLNEAEARYNLGAALERYGHPLSAKLQYEAATEADPSHSHALDALQRLAETETPTPQDTP